jgi:hypothetical protein
MMKLEAVVLSNAERQKRHRERQKSSRAAGGAVVVAQAALVDSLRRECWASVERLNTQHPGHTLADLIYAFLEQHPDPFLANTIGPSLCAMLDLPVDPWPGLTGPELDRLLGERQPEGWMAWARTREGELEFIEKLRAAHVRAWIEAPAPSAN